MLTLGPTGVGQSALLVYLLQQMAGVHRPRIFIIEAGGFFSLLGQHFPGRGLDVNQVTLNPGADVSLPPFADALRLLDKGRRVKLVTDTGVLEESKEEVGEGPGSDILGEMEIAARIMITCGDEREDARMTRADRLLIRNAILLAAKAVVEQGPRAGADAGRGCSVQQHQSRYRPAGTPAQPGARDGEGMALFCSGLRGSSSTGPASPGGRRT